MNDKRLPPDKLAGVAFEEALGRLAKKEPEEAAADSNESMKEGAIEKLIAKFEGAAEIDDEGTEFWTARNLQDLLGYSKWDSFLEVVEKAEIACKTTGQPVDDHFADVRKMVPIGSGAEREIPDMRLTRYACYLVAQNGDARKKPIAFAQTYFAIQTRRQEIQDDDIAQYTPLSEDRKRLLLRDEIKEHNRHLASAAKGAGVIKPLDFAIFQTFWLQRPLWGLRPHRHSTKQRP